MYYDQNMGMGFQREISSVRRQPTFQQHFIAIPVSNIREAEAFRVPLDGSITVFLDIQKDCIYTKQMNNVGIVELNTYQRFIEQPLPVPQYVPLEDFNMLRNQFSELESKLQSLGGKQNVSKPNATNTNGSK